MRNVYSIILFVFLITAFSCRSYKPGDPLDTTRSETALLQDYDTFRDILESGHPSIVSYLKRERLEFLFDSVRSTLNGGLSLRTFYNKLFYITNALGCSHTQMGLPSHITDTLYNRRFFFPLPLTLIEGRLLINSDHDLPHGTQLLSINERPADSILSAIAFYNPVEGYPRETQKVLAASDFGYQYYLKFGRSPVFDVRIKDTLGKVFDTSLYAVTLDELRTREAELYYFDPTDVPYSLHFNDEKNYAILRLTTFEFESYNSRGAFEDFLKNSFELLRKKPECKNLIIDLRENGGGYLRNCFLLYSYLARSPFSEYASAFTRFDRIPIRQYLASHYTQEDVDDINSRIRDEFIRTGRNKYTFPDSLISEWEPDDLSFRQNVFIINNAKVMSAATYFCTLVQNSGRGKIVGVENAGGENSGNGFETLDYSLPHSGLRVMFPYARILYTMGGPKTGSGIVPDHIVPDDLSSFMKNRDTQLKYITDSIISK